MAIRTAPYEEPILANHKAPLLAKTYGPVRLAYVAYVGLIVRLFLVR